MALITDLDDRTLVEQHRAGDPDAFRRIVSRHHRSLYSNALRRLGDPNAAEDAVQDAFLRAFRNIDHFDGDYHLDAWLHRIVTNTCHDIGRRRGRETRLFDRACTEVEVDVPGADEALDAMPMAQITDALDSLPQSYREVLVLRFVDELSYADVADKAGISEENARARVSRGRTMLKRMLTSTSALLVWAIPPLRRHAQLSGAEAEAANQAASQVHGLATIASVAPAPTSAFTQVSTIIAQAGPTIATAAPAVSGTAPAFKAAALAVGIAASVAIPAGVAVDRARQEPTAPVAAEVEEESAAASDDAPVVVDGVASPDGTDSSPPSSTTEPVHALTTGGTSIVDGAEPGTTSTAAPSTTVAPEPEPTTPTSTPPADDGAPAPAPAPEPVGETPPPAPVPTTPGQLSAAVTVTSVAGHLELDGPMNLRIGDEVFTGTLTGKVNLAEAGAKSQGQRQVERSDLTIRLDDGRVLELTVQGWSTVTQQGNGETHELALDFVLEGAPELGLADSGALDGTLILRHGSGELGLAIPGAQQDT